MFTKKCFMHNLAKLSNISKRKEPNYYSDFMIYKNKNKGWWNNKFKIDKYPNKNLIFNLEKNKGWWNNKQEIKKYNLK